jgi:hypothetical protein
MNRTNSVSDALMDKALDGVIRRTDDLVGRKLDWAKLKFIADFSRSYATRGPIGLVPAVKKQRITLRTQGLDVLDRRFKLLSRPLGGDMADVVWSDELYFSA